MFGKSKVPYNKTRTGKRQFELAQTAKENAQKKQAESVQALTESVEASNVAHTKMAFSKNKVQAKSEQTLKERLRITSLIEGKIADSLSLTVVESLRLDKDYMTANKTRLQEMAKDLFTGMFDAKILNFAAFEQSTVRAGHRLLANSRDFVFNQESTNDAGIEGAINEEIETLVNEASEVILQKLVVTVSNERDSASTLDESTTMPRHIQKKLEKETTTFWKAVNIFVAKENMALIDESFNGDDMELHNEQNIVESMVLFQAVSLLETIGIINPSKVLIRKISTGLVNSRKK